MTNETQNYVIEQLKWALQKAKDCGDFNAVAQIAHLIASVG